MRTNEKPHPWPQRRKIKAPPPYKPSHLQPFRVELEFSKQDWTAIYQFMAARRQLRFADLAPRLRAELEARLPGLVAYADERRLPPRLMNRAHTVREFGASRKRSPEPPVTTPSAAFDDLEAALAASLEALQR